jgi:crossover junction endodeoxyribonuclease RuvC
MIILSIDQGIAHFGYAILNVKKDSISLIDYGCFISNANGNQQIRVFKLINAFEALIDKYQPKYIIHERLFFSPPGQNSRKKSASILNTNMITGAIWYIAGKHEIEVFQYSPQTVKKELCGNGRAEKNTVISTIEKQFHIDCLKTHKEHICDAISIGLTFVKKEQIQTKLS